MLGADQGVPGAVLQVQPLRERVPEGRLHRRRQVPRLHPPLLLPEAVRDDRGLNGGRRARGGLRPGLERIKGQVRGHLLLDSLCD